MRRFSGAVLLLLLFLPCVVARAETPDSVPNPRQTRHSWVADNAGVLSSQTVRRLDAMIAQVERKSGAEIAVVTVRDLGGISVEEFANRLFNRWGVGKKKRDNGVMLLAAMNDRKFRIEVGDGLESRLSDARAGYIAREVVMPRFKEGDFDDGLYDGTLAVARRIDAAFQESTTSAAAIAPRTAAPRATARNATPISRSPAKIAPFAAPVKPSTSDAPPFNLPNMPSSFDAPPPSFSSNYRTSSPSSGGFSLLWLLALPVGIFAIFKLLSGESAPQCPQCRNKMQRVPEGAEDEYLNEVQQLEERVGGRDWQVWRCPRDGMMQIVPHDKYFSSVERCPACGHQTATASTRTLQVASEFSEGLQETQHLCHDPNCRHTWTTQNVTPRLMPQMAPSHLHSNSISTTSHHSSFSAPSPPPSHNSSDDNFGGGSSQGGGASGSW